MLEWAIRATREETGYGACLVYCKLLGGLGIPVLHCCDDENEFLDAASRLI